MRGAIFVEKSKNSKVGNVSATYVSIKGSCPSTCKLKSVGCYAQQSFVSIVNKRLEKRARQDKPLDLARSEAKAIDASFRGGKVPAGRPCRLHVSGDTTVVKGAKLINSAIKRWKKRGGGECWTYTHAWKNVKRSNWSDVSILASIESTNQVAEARANGYAPAIVINSFPSDKAFQLPGSDTKFIPCVAQTRDVSCEDCRLCFNANRLFEKNMGIAFSVHGINKGKLKRMLTVIQ